MSICVLITGAGGAGAIEIIRTLKELGRYRVIAVDAAPYAAGCTFADRGYIVPTADSPLFQPALKELIIKEKPDFVVPLVDEEILIVHRLVFTLPAPRPFVVAPSPPFCRATLDKWHTFRLLDLAGIPTPPTWLASDAMDCTFPAVIKPRAGRGSREVAYLASFGDLNAYLNRAPGTPDSYVIQKQIMGTEYTVSCVVGLGGPTLAVVPKECLVKQGSTQIGITRKVPEIDRVCRAIQDRFNANGPFNVQIIMGEDADHAFYVPYVIEINPRYSTSVALTIAAGINEVDVIVRHALGELIESLTFRPDLMMIRYTTQLYMPEVTREHSSDRRTS